MKFYIIGMIVPIALKEKNLLLWLPLTGALLDVYGRRKYLKLAYEGFKVGLPKRSPKT